MRKLTAAVSLVTILVAGALAAPSLYAQGSQEPPGSMMGHGMMGMMKMMKQMGQMMDHCSNMMSDNRPNDQWRKTTPSEPEKKG